MQNSNYLSILIVDDESELRHSISVILKNELHNYNLTISQAQDGETAVNSMMNSPKDLVIMDVRMPKLNGIDALKQIKESHPQTFIVLMTAHSNLQDAVQAIKNGAYDYLEKPVERNQLVEIVKKAMEAREMVSDLSISNPIFDDDIESDFIGSSKKMRTIFNLIYRLAQVETTVLIRGENGTGKELVAKAIHYNSPRKNGSLVALNCGAIPENLMESELFGHERGSFTGAIERKIGKFQLASQGTLFLDEIGELKPDMQVKLLRVLQEKKFTPVGGSREVKTNARIVAATNRNLEKLIEENKFREDLFYRLNVMPIFLPPLRDRIEDLPQLIEYFIQKFTKQHGRTLKGTTDQALRIMQRHNWPGNIRELENAIERAFIISNTQWIDVDALPEGLLKSSENQSREALALNPENLDFERFKEESEKEFIIEALKVNCGRINKTVAQANIPKNTLLRKIRKYGIDVKEFLIGDKH